MPKDWKIGFVTGFIFVSLGAIWFCANPQQDNKTASSGQTSEAVSFDNEAKKKQSSSVSNELSQTFTEHAPLILSSSQEPEITSELPPLPSSKSVKLYIVEKGDTLSLIAEKVYGNKDMWHKIRDANKIQNINALHPGTKLIVP